MIETKFSEIFSEFEKQGLIVAPVSQAKIKSLALAFSEKQADELAAAFKEMKVVKAGEEGSSAEGSEFNDGVTEEEVKFFTEKM